MRKEMENKSENLGPVEILPEGVGNLPAIEAAPLLERASSRIQTLGWKGDFWDGVKENLEGASAWIKASKAGLVKRTLSVVVGAAFLTTTFSACSKGPSIVATPSETGPRVTEVSPITTESAPTTTSTPTEAPTEIPTPEWSPSAEFLSQFDESPFSFVDNQILYSPEGGNKIPIASIESAKLVFNVNGQEVTVDSSLAVVPEAKWFLHGADDQIMAVNDETGTYWQYEFDRETKEWQEKNLPEVSIDISNPTEIGWNDIVGNRWATAVRQAIDAGQIPTFGPDVVVSSMGYEPNHYQSYNSDNPGFVEQGLPYRSNPATRPIMYAGFGQIEVDGYVHKMASLQVAERGGGYGLYNVIEYGERYGDIWSLSIDVANNNVWLSPHTKINIERPNKGPFSLDEPTLSLWLESDQFDVQPAIDKWINDGVLDPVLGKVVFMYSTISW